MKKSVLIAVAVILAVSIIACPILYFTVGPALAQNQIETLIILGIITGCSFLYCFIVGELTNNNSQMDKLWSILPEIYVWVIAIKGGMQPRLVIMAILATLWGIRLTYNFGKKGAYKLKFWTGEEDYRWIILREREEFKPHWKWALFNLFFISLYQNVLVLIITFPALVSMNSTVTFHWMDAVAIVLMLSCIIFETIADAQMWNFQCGKKVLLSRGKTIGEMPAPYNKGFCTVGLWKYSRHPNYAAEQGIWICFYLFSIGAGIGIFNWSLIGALLLIILFIGSSTFAEGISKSKYPEYANYQKKVSRFFLWKGYK